MESLYMVAALQQKEQIKWELAACLSREKEVRTVVVFGSFLTSVTHSDLDVALFQDSDEMYRPLAMKYRRLLRPIADRIPIDVIPVRANGASGSFPAEIQKGEVAYER
jgi:predicted nucleotidyltransferase